jgi:hypothetical protein
LTHDARSMDEPGSNIQISQGVWQSFLTQENFEGIFRLFFEQKFAPTISCKSETR